MACIPSEDLNQILDLDWGGNAYVKCGTTPVSAELGVNLNKKIQWELNPWHFKSIQYVFVIPFTNDTVSVEWRFQLVVQDEWTFTWVHLQHKTLYVYSKVISLISLLFFALESSLILPFYLFHLLYRGGILQLPLKWLPDSSGTSQSRAGWRQEVHPVTKNSFPHSHGWTTALWWLNAIETACLPYTVGKQPSIPLINLWRKWMLKWWWWWWWLHTTSFFVFSLFMFLIGSNSSALSVILWALLIPLCNLSTDIFIIPSYFWGAILLDYTKLIIMILFVPLTSP